jgi:3-phenylpropionate/trans-cinnamate dioxygenase ferredoxin subunit
VTRPQTEKHPIAAVDEIPPEGRKLVTVKGRTLAVFNIKGEFFGLFNKCPHQGGKLCEGSLIGLIEASEPGAYRYSRPGEFIRCPWHGWEFDIRTGQSYCDPKHFRVKSYDVKVEPGSELVKGPYIAETVTVSVEDDYVVVHI